VSDGILLVDKPAGPTSAQVVRQIKRRFGEPSIGHLGTLDPMATGLLPLCLGAGTKIAQFLAAEQKAYEGEIQLGLATDTLDVTGRTTAEAPIPPLDADALARAARDLTGRRLQKPPMYSAVKIGGRELYKLAREGVEIDRPARAIAIFALELAASPEPGRVRFAVHCSKGTYVRVLAEEVGRALGTLATLASLRRTAFGAFSIADAHGLDDLLARPPGEELPVIDVRTALQPLRELQVGADLARAIACGQRAALARLETPLAGESHAAVIAPSGVVLAVVGADPGGWVLKRVLMPEASQLYRT
jgi:tRNA pseudouridine55 synthase